MKEIKRSIAEILIVIGIMLLIVVWLVGNGNFAYAKNQRYVGNHGKIASTQYGLVKGFFDSYDTCCWKGIPYAKPPAGELRWKAPRDPESWKGILKAADFSAVCPQYSEDSTIIIGSEDCLYLNVWSPRDHCNKPLPVYFWIHGGGNTVGTACDNRYNGAKLASKGRMVVVTINYRLGPFGWLTHPALRDGNGVDNSGNFGTLDIIKALEWVKGNISSFCGDPDNVTIAGVSAGGLNALSLLISPLAKNLFHRLVSESGPTVTFSVSEGERQVEELVIARLLEKDNLEEVPEGDIANYLRGKTPEELLSAYDTRMYSMLKDFTYIFRDGTVIPFDGYDTLQDCDRYNQVPIIVGSTKEEHKFFMWWNDYDNRESDASYQEHAEYMTNIVFWKPRCVDCVAATLSPQSNHPGVYAYRFDYGAYRYTDDYQPDQDQYNAWPTGPINYALMIGASHAMEISFFWGYFKHYGYGEFLFREDNRLGQEALSDACMEYISNFAHDGVPSAYGLPVWEKWSNDDDGYKRIILDANNSEVLIEMSCE